uniref:Uncharacterized protein n=1 Tax=Cyanothece sp. (strain PCC 7425 / ATCC 29141) TaxID=395961 RepID=B8HTP9_CYAP4
MKAEMKLCNNVLIRIPSIIHKENTSKDSLPYFEVRFLCDKQEFENYLYLNIDMAKDISNWLKQSINLVESIQDEEVQEDRLLVEELNLEDIDENKIRSIGKINVDAGEFVSIDTVAVFSDKILSRFSIINQSIFSYYLSNRNSRRLIDGFNNAVKCIKNTPPRVVSNTMLGTLTVLNSCADQYQVTIQGVRVTLLREKLG